MERKNNSSQDPILDIPLLQEPNHEPGGATMSSAVFNVSTTMVGAGIMSVPATMKTLGIVPGLISILIVAFLAEVTVDFLLRFTRSAKCTTYGGLMADSFGPFGSVAVQICVMITNLGCLIIYLIILGDVLCGNRSGESIHTGILQELFGIHWWNSRAVVILLVVLFVMLPLVLLRQVDSLRHSSAVSIGLAVVFVVISSAMAIHALWTGKTQKPRLVPDFTKVSVLDLFTTIPIFVTGFGFHMVVHPIKAELQKSSDMSLAVRISLLICIAIYFTIGFFGYLLFGDTIMPDMLVNFDKNSDSSTGLVINDIVRLSYAIHLALVFPLMNYSLRANVDEFLFPKKPALALDTTRFVSLTCGLLTITYTVAVALPNIWYFFQFMGSTTIVCLAFIFPAAIVLRDVHGISTKKDKIIAILVIILAVMTSAVAIYTNLLS
ncbi:amino acid transporter AVT6C-like [Carica papaya]|uniref:amino acid transporter AVT6C-like n=1 Tax=Carica papaya TaxID=3649 RepID=UPI000B8C7437|nr:amino acid transporter AVT6C-like [Carica papaya]